MSAKRKQLKMDEPSELTWFLPSVFVEFDPLSCYYFQSTAAYSDSREGDLKAMKK